MQIFNLCFFAFNQSMRIERVREGRGWGGLKQDFLCTYFKYLYKYLATSCEVIRKKKTKENRLKFYDENFFLLITLSCNAFLNTLLSKVHRRY